MRLPELVKLAAAILQADVNACELTINAREGGLIMDRHGVLRAYDTLAPWCTTLSSRDYQTVYRGLAGRFVRNARNAREHRRRAFTFRTLLLRVMTVLPKPVDYTRPPEPLQTILPPVPSGGVLRGSFEVRLNGEIVVTLENRISNLTSAWAGV